jgi:hypothetical protein
VMTRPARSAIQCGVGDDPVLGSSWATHKADWATGWAAQKGKKGEFSRAGLEGGLGFTPNLIRK